MEKKKILIVEDERIVAKDLKRRLEIMNYTVSGTAVSGEEALIQFETSGPDLILMDIRIEGQMDGIETAQKILEKKYTPIIYLTAFSDHATLERAKKTGPFGYILKPFEERELQITIEMALYKHQMEKKLRESEEWFATTLSSIGDGVIATDEQGIVRFMNLIAEELTGWKLNKAKGQNLKEIFHIINEETREKVDNPVYKVIEQGIIVGLANHTILIKKDGSEIIIDDSAAPIRDENGKLMGVVLVFRDVSEKRKQAKELEESEYRFRTLANMISSAAIICQDDAIVYANFTAEKMTGYSFEELSKKTVLSLFHPNVQPLLVEKGIGKSCQTFFSYCSETRLMTKDQKELWVHLNSQSIQYKGQKALLLSLFDITERIENMKNITHVLQKNLQDTMNEIKFKEEMLIQQSKQAVMGEMIENIAHQWKQPLSAIGLLIQNIKMAQKNNQLSGDFIEKHYQESMDIINHMTHTIDSFRNFLKPDRHEINFNLKDLIEQTVDMIQDSFKFHNIGVRLKLQENLPMYGNPNELSQVLLNLLVNAKDSVLENDIKKPLIEISLLNKDDKKIILIIDNAGGIPEKIASEIFKPYFTTKKEGTGIGLYMSRNIIDKSFQGTLTFKNNGQGTEFKIEI
ncbi:MAG: hypothetical protein A2Y41_07605 [Spirochaetes bacterium GWB1_36_13]|nr:MAG: hypothetical protein A2Y41_07605 [Spirochaetes bacterium GWB1_36_13]